MVEHIKKMHKGTFVMSSERNDVPHKLDNITKALSLLVSVHFRFGTGFYYLV